jgi:hypothetical protein
MRIRHPLPFAHSSDPRHGEAFIDYLDRICSNNRLRRQRQLAFIHEWDHLIDQLGRQPTVSEYADRWRTPRSTAYALLHEFRQLFPNVADPTRVCEELWNGVSAQQHDEPSFLINVDRVRVVPVTPWLVA